MGLLVDALHWGPTPVATGIERCRELLATAGENPASRAMLNATLGAMLASQGSFDEARELYAESAELNDRMGLRFRRAVSALYGAEIELLAGDPPAAESELRRAYETLEAMGESGTRAVVAALLAFALCSQERDDESWALIELAEEITDPGDLFPLVLERTTRARLLARQGATGPAEEMARDALALAATTDCVSLHAHTRLALATALAQAGRHDDARELIDQARAIHQAKGNLVAAERVAALVALTQPL